MAALFLNFLSQRKENYNDMSNNKNQCRLFSNNGMIFLLK